MLSQTAEYALRAMVYLATTHPEPATSRAVADACQVPAEYLSKILHGLRRSGLVTSKRGKRGGFVLDRPPTEITLLDVVDCVDPIERVLECPRRLEEHCVELCPLHRFLDAQAAHMRESLGGQTIWDLASGSPKTFPNIA